MEEQANAFKEKKICGCQSSTIVKIINVSLGLFAMVFSAFSLINILDLLAADAIIVLAFKVYQV